MATRNQRKKQTSVKKDVIDIGLEQVTLEMSRMLKDFHKNLRNISLLGLNIKEPTLKSENHPHKGQLGLKAVQAAVKSNKEPAKSGTPNNNQKSSANSQNKEPVKKNAAENISQKSSVNSQNNKNVNRKGTAKEPAKKSPSTISKKSNSSKTSEDSKKLINPITLKQPIQIRTTILGTAVESLRSLQDVAEKAKQERRTFTVCGNYHSIRKALIDRGWIEKIRLSYNMRDRENLRHLQSMPINELITKVKDKDIGNACKRMIMSKFLYNHQVDFYWDDFNDAFKVNNDKQKYTLINKFKRTIFSYTSKQGLCEAVKRAHWYQKPGTSIVRHPRSYSLTDKGDPRDFVEDYKITAAISLLKWIVATSTQKKVKLMSDSGRIPIEAFHFAVEECVKVIKKAKHEDIDCDIEDALDYQWNQFLDYYNKLVHIGNHFKTDQEENEATIVKKAQYILNKLETVYPNLDMDGMMNIWILKPIAGCQGRGIHICRTLQYILQVVKTNTTLRYVIQKYIEKPLLIYNTKFDIRQWFLISSATPLTIWIYKECYLRFCSQTYNLRKLHESIHLTNNSVQSKYKNTGRDIALPNYNMWDTNQFKTYLRNIGFPNAFEKSIYPEMKQCITGAILLNQDHIDVRRNSFELYGADFMLTENFQPWLIEINAKPALFASTPVTAKMCPQVLADVIKVIIDVPQNPKAKTGNFELIYKQNIPAMPKVDGTELKLEGTPLNNGYFCDILMPEASEAINAKENAKIDEIQEYICKVKAEMHNALQHLLDVIDNEKTRREAEILADMEFKKKALDTKIKGQNAPDVQNKGKKAPDVQNKEKNAPNVQNKEKKAPDVQNKEKNAPDVQNKGKSAPDIQNKEKNAPDLQNKETIALETNNIETKTDDVLDGFIEDCDSVEEFIISENQYECLEDNGVLNNLLNFFKNVTNKSTKCT